MANWKPIVGLSFNAAQFDNYCHSLQWVAWRPSFIVLHNTGTPNLDQRPNGFTQKHMENFVAFYRDQQGWSAGPHLFIDDKKIWVFTPLTMSGVHSPSWNKQALGIEMLGDYSKDSFKTNRGLAVRQNAVAAMSTLCAVLGFDPATIKLHKEDPGTTHDCPGKNVKKDEVIAEVQALIQSRHGGGHIV
jgi:N-acetylmuramoyl-L-alanine amidase.